MKIVVIVLVAVLLFTMTVHADKTYKRVERNQYCQRKLSGGLSNGGRTLTVDSRLNCRGERPTPQTSDQVTDGGDKSGGAGDRRMARVSFQMSTSKLPSFAARGMRKDADSVAGFLGRFGFDRVIEYVESNKTAGFQPDEDTIVKTMYLANARLLNNQWSQISCTNLKQTDDTMPISCSSSLTPPSGSMIDGMTLRADVTPQEVEVAHEGVTKTKKILTPNSFKLDVSITGIKYSQENTRFAVGTFFIFKGVGQKRERDDKTEEERPDDATENQGVLQLEEDSTDAGFFSWDRYISVKNADGTFTSKKLHSSSLIPDNNNSEVEKDSDESTGFQVVRVWFTPEDRVENLLWDPSMGVTEEKVSGASRIVMSTFALVVAIATIFFSTL